MYLSYASEVLSSLYISLLSILSLHEYSSFSEFPHNLTFMKLKNKILIKILNKILINPTRQKVNISRVELCVNWTGGHKENLKST